MFILSCSKDDSNSSEEGRAKSGGRRAYSCSCSYTHSNARANPSDGRSADIASRIANQPGAKWFGNWSGDIGSAIAVCAVGVAARANR